MNEGFYTVVEKTGEYRTYKFKTVTKGDLEGKLIVYRGSFTKNEGFAFLFDDRVAIWKRFKDHPDINLWQSDVQIILNNPKAAQLAYAMREGRCARCNRILTAPASISHGLGPECFGKTHWTKQDQIEAYFHT